MRVKVGLIQMDCSARNVESNIRNAKFLIKKASERGAEIVCLPELFTTGYRLDNISEKGGEVEQGERVFDELKSLALELGIYIIAAIAKIEGRLTSTSSIQNSAILVTNQGEIAGYYSKIHLSSDESKCFEPGEEIPIFTTAFGRIGIAICRDVCFPEVTRILTLKGARLIFVPAAWETRHSHIYDIILPARALENTVFLAVANRTGCNGEKEFFGRSKIIGGNGSTIAEAEYGVEQVLVAEVDLSRVTELRKEIGFLSLRRPECYRDIIMSNRTVAEQDCQ